VQKHLKDIYKNRFPELEQIVLNPVEYTKIVMQIKNEFDLGRVDLSQLLTGHQMMAVNVASSSTLGQPLSEEHYR
jgi:U4/U6 small nuclear ribonucleoprotein PRP31